MSGGLFILANGNKLSLTFYEFSRLFLLFLFRDPFPKVSSFLRHGHRLVLSQNCLQTSFFVSTNFYCLSSPNCFFSLTRLLDFFWITPFPSVTCKLSLNVSWCIHRAQLMCFPSLGDNYCLYCPMSFFFNIFIEI